MQIDGLTGLLITTEQKTKTKTKQNKTCHQLQHLTIEMYQLNCHILYNLIENVSENI